MDLKICIDIMKFLIWTISFTECGCIEKGCIHKSCDNDTGECKCKPHVVGAKCDKCEDGYFGWPDCERKIFILNGIYEHNLIYSIH